MLPPVQFSEEQPAAGDASGDMGDEEPDFLAFEEEEGGEAAAPEAVGQAAEEPASDADERGFEE